MPPTQCRRAPVLPVFGVPLYLCVLCRRTTKFGMVTHWWRACFRRSTTSLYLHKYVRVLATESCREAWRPSSKVDPGAFSGQRQGWKPQEDPLAVHCFCVCSGSALLGDLLGVSRSKEGDLSVLLIFPGIFLHVFIAYHVLVGFLFM